MSQRPQSALPVRREIHAAAGASSSLDPHPAVHIRPASASASSPASQSANRTSNPLSALFPGHPAFREQDGSRRKTGSPRLKIQGIGRNVVAGHVKPRRPKGVIAQFPLVSMLRRSRPDPSELEAIQGFFIFPRMGEDGQEVPYRRAGWAGNDRLGISRHRYAEYTPGSRRNSPSAPAPAASSHHHHRHHHHHHRHSSSSDENRRQNGPPPRNEPGAAPDPSGKHAELTPARPLLPRCIQEYASQDLDRSDLPREEEKSPGNGAGKGPSAASELAETNWEAFVESGNDGNGSVDAIEVIERGLAILNRGWKGLRGNREAQGALGRVWSRHGALSSAAIGVADSWRCEAMRLRTLLAEHGIVDAEGPGLGRDEGASHQFVSEEELEEEVVRRVKTHLDMAAQQLQDEALMERQQRRRDVDAEDVQQAGADSHADADRGVDDVDGGGDDSEMDGDRNDGIDAAAAKQNDQQPMLVSKVEALEEGGLGEKLGRLEAKVSELEISRMQLAGELAESEQLIERLNNKYERSKRVCKELAGKAGAVCDLVSDAQRGFRAYLSYERDGVGSGHSRPGRDFEARMGAGGGGRQAVERITKEVCAALCNTNHPVWDGPEIANGTPTLFEWESMMDEMFDKLWSHQAASHVTKGPPSSSPTT